MPLLIIAAIVYALWFDSIPAAIIGAALILYRAQRPSQFVNRVREMRYLRQATSDE